MPGLSSISLRSPRTLNASTLESPRYAYLIAELEGQMVGLVAMRDQKHLFHLFVAPAHQRIGIARALWERARQLSLQTGPITEFTGSTNLERSACVQFVGFVPAVHNAGAIKA